MKIRNLVFLIVSVFSLALGGYAQPVQAQGTNEPTGFKNVTLWVYPEYDDPRLLVMLEGKITGATAPATVTFLVPSTAQMYSAGSKDAQGNYSGGPPDRKPSQLPGWDEISYQLKTDTFRVEYYDTLITGKTDKKISYDFRWLIPIADLKVIVQVPRYSTNFSVIPQGTQSTEEGFPVYVFNYNNPDLNLPLHFDLAYTKSDTRTSVENKSSSANAGDGWNYTPIVISAAVLLVLGAFVLVIRSRRNKVEAPKFIAKSPQARSIRRKNSINKYCNQCGKATVYPSRFCPHCGSKINKSDGA